MDNICIYRKVCNNMYVFSYIGKRGNHIMNTDVTNKSERIDTITIKEC